MPHKPRLLLLIYIVGIAVFLLSFGGTPPVRSQDTPSDAIPPQVIDVSPFPGVELAPADKITITFNQPMNQASVESAWRVEPALNGTFAWTDARTVEFTPEGGWQPAQEYRVSIEPSAVAENGLNLPDPYIFKIRTIGNIEVTAVTPADAAEGVAADAQIVVTFNRPVVPLVSTEQFGDLPTPLTIEPAIEGTGEWLNTSIYTFSPKDVWQGGTTYTLTIDQNLVGFDGATITAPFTWSFKTLPPQILYISPSAGSADNLLDSTVNITLSQPMDKASTEAAFSLVYRGEPVAGAFVWDESATSFTYTPTNLLTIESEYTINIAPTARSANGEAMLPQGQTQTFRTVPLPGIASTYPANGESVRPGGGATIYFKSPMNTETFADKVVISPEIEWTPSVWGNDSLYVGFNSLPKTTYTITFKAGAEDIYGNAIPTDYTFQFTTTDIDNWGYPISTNIFQTTGAYRNNTRIALIISGQPNVNFKVYRLPLQYTEDYLNYRYYYDDRPNPWETPENLVREWSQTFDSKGLSGVPQEVYLASDTGGVLPNGLYWIKVDTSSNTYYRSEYEFALNVATANITAKRAADSLMVWVTDLPSGQPVVETNVSVYHKGNMIARGQTDSDGIFRTPIDVPYNDGFLSIVAEDATTYGFWSSASEPSLPTAQNYLYTDRPIYRPGETVYFKGVLRNRTDMDYSIPNRSTAFVQVDSYTGERIYEGDVTITPYGTFSGQFTLSEEVALGTAYINVSNDIYIQFEIAEFRVPEFLINVTPQQDYIFQGDPLSALSEAKYYFGGVVSSANVNWFVTGYETSFNYTGSGRYTFGESDYGWWYYDYYWDYGGNSVYYNGSGTTDANGQYLINVDSVVPSSETKDPILLTIEANVTDESNQQISGRSTMLLHAANVYVGLRTEQYFGREGQPMNVYSIAVDADSNPLADHPIDLTLVELRWERIPVEGQFGRYTWNQTEIEVEKVQVRTGDDGTATYTFTPPNAGIFIVRGSSIDERERTNTSSVRFWVTGTRPVWWGQPSDTVDLIADADSYKPGDTAQILVPIPFAGKSNVLVTTERAGIQSYEVLEVEGSTLLYELPITEEHVPTIYFTVTIIKGIDEESAHPDHRTGVIALNVEPVQEIINVTVTPSKEVAQPRDNISFEITTTDVNGNPVAAEVGVLLTDKAILSLLGSNSSSLQDTFYGSQGNYIYSSVLMTSLIDKLVEDYVGEDKEEDVAQRGVDESNSAGEPTPTAAPTAQAEFAAADGFGAAGGSAPGQPPVVVREDFQQTPLWSAHVVTDATGKATVSVDLPDNLTTWELDARALTLQTQVGQTTNEVMVTLPLLIRPATPRFLVVGDRVQLAAVVNNNTDQEQTVEVTLEHVGVDLASDERQQITIAPFSRARVEWTAIAQDVPYVDLTFIAVSSAGYTDASKPTLATGPDGTIPVYRYTAPDTVGTAGILRTDGSRLEGISLPPRLVDTTQGELIIHVDPSLAVATTDTFNYLKNYPHQCIEQTVSRFLPNIKTYTALKSLGIQDPVLEANLVTALEQGIAKLKAEQRYDGGWGWFYNMESDPLVTAYAALGLIEARNAGFDIDQLMIDRALNFVRTDYINPDINTSNWRLNRQAFYFYVLAQDGQGNLSDYDNLYVYRLKMSYGARAYFLMAYQKLFPTNPAINDLVSDLTTGAILSATGAHWEEEYNDWWNWSSDTRTTALALNALVKATPDSDLLPNAVRWLMVARQGDHWETTQENVWATMALTEWMVITGELQGDYDYVVNLNNNELAQGTVTPDTVREGQTLRVAIRDLLLEDINRLVVARDEGEGVLYYTAHLDLRLFAQDVDALNRGINVQREYFNADDPENPVTSAEIGDVITVRLTLNLDQDIYYFVLEDPLPAGMESVNTALLTTSQQVAPPTLKPQRNRWYFDLYNPYWYWGWWYFDHTELRDEQTNLYADFLPRGTYVYTYQIRATTPGEFQTMPSHAYAFYFPEVFGRTKGELFTITPATDVAE